jgi:hypothetical protein
MMLPEVRNLRLLGLCLVLTWLGLAGSAHAQSFLRVSPGPLNASHEAYDNSDGCPQCHVSGEGVSNGKCLACHKNLLHKGGLHTTFGGKACTACHTDHKGRAYSIINWNTVGGRDSFNHDTTGFPLKFEHAKVACTRCHSRRLKSGRASYLGLSRDCQSCHRGVHAFTRSDFIRKCDICHQPGQPLRGMRLRQWLAPHGQYSNMTFEGVHVDQTCLKCHPKGNMSGRPARTCASCHPATHPVGGSMANCTRCHPANKPWKGATIDHNQFGFPLNGRHKIKCRSCHGRGGRTAAKGAAGTTVIRKCADCHPAQHPVTFGLNDCARCHPSGGSWRGAKVNHTKFGFPILGGHKGVRCSVCHKKGEKLEYSEGACTSCHRHQNAHNGQFTDKPCSDCHVEGGKRKKPWDHNTETRFPLVGLHAVPKVKSNCAACHPNKLYRTNKTACVDCHQDKHNGQLGKDCAKCHSVMNPFKQPTIKGIDHGRFPLEGKHLKIACRDCHKDGNYKLGHKECVDCHKKDDVHKGKLGDDCGKCHLATKGAPKFRHNRMTHFRLTGAHRTVTCAKCHQPKSRRAPPTVAQWKRGRVPPLNREFPVRGTRCLHCHFDVHKGYVGKDCEQCHNTTSWKSISGARARVVFPADHRGAWLRRHALLPMNDGEPGAEDRYCAVCHGSPSCVNCHRTRTPRSHTGLWRVKAHGTAASFDSTSCRVCHHTAACTACHRRTPPLNHRGPWLSSHGYASGGFGDTNCYVCHRRADCTWCHRRQ